MISMDEQSPPLTVAAQSAKHGQDETKQKRSLARRRALIVLSLFGGLLGVLWRGSHPTFSARGCESG
jgi:hypothetical protein